MHIGILALALVFILSGLKNLQDSGLFMKKKQREQQEENQGKNKNESFPRRRMYFGLLLSFLGLLILIYYFVYI